MSAPVLPACRCGAAPQLVEIPVRRAVRVVCFTCQRKSRDFVGPTRREAAAASWAASEDPEQNPQLLYLDDDFQTAVLDRHVDFAPLGDGDPHPCQRFRVPESGKADALGNAAALVAFVLAPKWPALESLVDPCALVHAVLRKAGKGTGPHPNAKSGRYAGEWHPHQPRLAA